MSSDPYASSVSSLLHFEAPVDNITGTSLILNNGATLSTAQYKFGTSSLLCDSTGKYANLPSTYAAAVGTSPFTVECWVRFNSSPANAGFVSPWGTGWTLGYYNGTLRFATTIGYTMQYSWTPSINTWYAIAVDRDAGNTFRMYINGTMVYKIGGVTGNFYTPSQISIGSFLPWYSETLDGYIDEFRLTKGVARYASDAGYTPDTSEFLSQFGHVVTDYISAKSFGFYGPLTSIPQDPLFSSTSLLLHCANAYNEVNGETGAFMNGASSSPAAYKFGDSSFSFNGSSQYVYMSPSNNYTFGTNPFTVEFWINFNSVSASAVTFLLARNSGFYFGYNGTQLQFYCYNDGANALYTWTPTTGVWYALAVERDANNVLRLYINGQMVLKSSGFSSNFSGASSYLSIGSNIPDSNSGHFNGYIDEVRITKAARYGTDFGYTPATTAFQPAASAIQVDTTAISSPLYRYIAASITNSYQVSSILNAVDPYELIETLGWSGVLNGVVPFGDQIDEYTQHGDMISLVYGALIANVVGIADPLRVTNTVKALDLFYAADNSAQTTTYNISQPELTAIRDTLRLGVPLAVSDTVGTSDITKVVQSLRIAEALKLQELVVAGAKYTTSIFDGVAWADALRRFFAGEAIDGVGIQSVVAPQYRANMTLTQNLGIQQTDAAKLVFRVVAEDSVELDLTGVLKMLFAPALSEGVEISAAYVQPNGSLTTWAVNTEIGAVTEYSNYEFNSFAQIGYKYLGASSSGLYELNGDDDAGTDIVSVIKSGLAQFGGSRFAMFKAAYLGVRGGGDYVFRLETGDGRFYDYDIVAQDMQTTKIRLGKGLRARYFSFQLTSTGQDFDLDSIEFVPLVAQRRV